MACTYDSRGPGPLSASAMMQPGGYLEQMGVDGVRMRAPGEGEEGDIENGGKEEEGEEEEEEEELEPFVIDWVSGQPDTVAEPSPSSSLSRRASV